MKASELRIGNLVYYKVKQQNGFERNKVVEVDTCVIADISVEGLLSKLYSPIPLTEEWLLKFGFEDSVHDQIGTTWNRGQFDIIQQLPHLPPDFGICLNGIGVFTKYVHQLQNLYFALTGEELKINAPHPLEKK